MRIAYLILAHRYPEQLLRLVERLDGEFVSFLIHLDRRSDRGFSEIVHAALQSKRNVHFVERYACAWAGFGIVQATYRGIKEAIEMNLEYDYLILLSGQDYPIKSNARIERFLEANRGRSFIHCNPFPYGEWMVENGGWDRVRTWNFVGKERRIRFPDKRLADKHRLLRSAWRRGASLFPERRFPHGFHPHGGAQFWGLCARHARFVYDFIEDNPAFFEFFRYVFVPDEILFQTIMGNSPFSREIEKDGLTFLEWDRPGAVLVAADFPSIWESHYLFARKFDLTIDSRILDQIDHRILAIPSEAV